MLFWIFDLDHTLYQTPNKNDFFSYSKLSKDRYLDKCLKHLPCKKVIFTNGTFYHAKKCLNILNIENNFNNIIARDTINCMKPNIESYFKTSLLCDINYNDKCVFFEDSISNLSAAKKFNWITVYISPEKKVHDFIDFWFPNIHSALEFFISKIYN